MAFKKILYTINQCKPNTYSNNMAFNLQQDRWLRMLAVVSQCDLSFQPQMPLKKVIISRKITETMLIVLLQYMGLMLSAFSPVWLATGTACAFVFLRGLSVLPGVWLGTFFAYYFAKAGIGVAFACATEYMLQTFFLLWLCYRYISPTLLFYRRSTLLKFVLYSGFLTGVTSLMLEYSCFATLDHTVTPFQHWLQWWLANWNGIFIVGCALVTLDAYFPQIDTLKQQNIIKLSLPFGLLLVLIMMLLCSKQLLFAISFSLLISLLIFIISSYLGWCGAVAGIFLFGMMLSLASYLNAPLFAGNLFVTSFYLQVIMLITAITGLWIAIKNNFNGLTRAAP